MMSANMKGKKQGTFLSPSVKIPSLGQIQDGCAQDYQRVLSPSRKPFPSVMNDCYKLYTWQPLRQSSGQKGFYFCLSSRSLGKGYFPGKSCREEHPLPPRTLSCFIWCCYLSHTLLKLLSVTGIAISVKLTEVLYAVRLPRSLLRANESKMFIFFNRTNRVFFQQSTRI